MNIFETLNEDTGNSVFAMLAGDLDVVTPDNIRNYLAQYALGIHADISDVQEFATDDWTITQEGIHLVFKYKNIEKYRIEV